MIATRLAARVVERNVLAYRRMWFVFLTGFAEPVLFLLSIGVGVGALVGDLQVGGHTVSYDEFVAPGLLAMSAMSGALLDATFNFFVKYKYTKVYDAVLATPIGTGDLAVGEVVWSLLRGAIYSTFFLLTMLVFGLVGSWWAVLAAPVAVLIGFAFAGAGLAATTWMRSFLDFDYVNLAIVPLFLFSATFFPLVAVPGGARSDHPRHAAVPRGGPGALARARRRALVAVPQRRVSLGDGRRRRAHRRPPSRPPAPTLT